MAQSSSIGLYDPRFEHEACGLSALARLDGRPDHELVERALRALVNLDHRGATGADPETGDGAGIMTQLPHRFLRRAFREAIGHDLPPPGSYATGIVFLPREPSARMRCEELCVRICAEEGQRALGWRDVPVDGGRIGELARASEPVVRQLFVEHRRGDAGAFERKLYVIRRRVERAAAAAGVAEAEFTIVSLSSLRLVYKGLLRAPQLSAYYADLRDPRFESALALVHSRFSTNTFGTWDLAHPFNFLAHNGEINTVRGNANWLAAREPQLRSALLGDDLQKLYPILDERWSDSAKLDAAVELLVLGGRSLAHALTMLVPPAWTDPGPCPTTCARSTSTGAWPSRGTARPRSLPATAPGWSARSTATACGPRGSYAAATASRSSPPRWAWPRSTRPTSSSTVASAPGRCSCSTPSAAGSSPTAS